MQMEGTKKKSKALWNTKWNDMQFNAVVNIHIQTMLMMDDNNLIAVAFIKCSQKPIRAYE